MIRAECKRFVHVKTSQRADGSLRLWCQHDLVLKGHTAKSPAVETIFILVPGEKRLSFCFLGDKRTHERNFSWLRVLFFSAKRRNEERKLFIILFPIHTHLPVSLLAPKNERLLSQPKRIESNIFWRALPHVCVWGVFHELLFHCSCSFSSGTFYSFRIPNYFWFNFVIQVARGVNFLKFPLFKLTSMVVPCCKGNNQLLNYFETCNSRNRRRKGCEKHRVLFINGGRANDAGRFQLQQRWKERNFKIISIRIIHE